MIVAFTLVFALVAYAYSAHKIPYYESTAELLYSPQLNVSDPLGQNVDPTVGELQLQDAAATITRPQIAKQVATLTSDVGASSGASVSAAVTNTAPGASGSSDNAVAVTVESTDPDVSAKLANAYAQAFVAYSLSGERARLRAAQTVVSAQLKTLAPSSADYATLSLDQQDLEILAATATGDFTLAVPASPASAPVWPKPKKTAAEGALFGLVCGIVLAFLRERLDVRLHSRQEVSEITGLPVLGRIGTIPAAALARGPLVVASGSDDRTAEAIRLLRTNLQFASLGEKNRALAVMSARRGEGKSLLAANLAVSLALAGERVALIDADLRQPRAHALFGLSNTRGVSSVIAGLCSLDEALQTWHLDAPRVVLREGQSLQGAIDGQGPLLKLLTSGPLPPNPSEMVGSQGFQTLVCELAVDFDYVVIDSPALLAVGDAVALTPVVDGIVLLVNMKLVDRPTLEETGERLRRLSCTKLGVVVAREPGKTQAHRYRYDTGDRHSGGGEPKPSASQRGRGRRIHDWVVNTRLTRPARWFEHTGKS